ncbi:hypothetical protein BaRGS_00001835 [Batillaria attramentaria]|uniref:CUB domain-containing protein n=1 Tax=Batillaria attramentaria TaxID=370345 RepID=A0ABD0M562_9CAEN
MQITDSVFSPLTDNASAKVIGKFCSMSQWKFSSSGRYLYIRFESDTQSSMAYFILYYKAELRTHPRTTTRRARTTTSTEPPSSKADGGLSFHSFPTWVLYFVVAVALFIFFYFAIKICVGKSKCGTSATGVPVNDNSAAAARDGDSDGAHPGSPETAALTAEPSTAADSPPSYFSLQHDCASPAPSAPQPHGASARPSEPPPSPGAPPDYASLFPAHGTSDYYYKSEVLGEDCSCFAGHTGFGYVGPGSDRVHCPIQSVYTRQSRRITFVRVTVTPCLVGVSSFRGQAPSLTSARPRRTRLCSVSVSLSSLCARGQCRYDENPVLLTASNRFPRKKLIQGIASNNHSVCGWQISADPGHTVKLEVLSADMIASDCDHAAYFKVFDGASSKQELLQKFCEKPEQVIRSSGPSMYLEFTVNEELVYYQLEFTYQGVLYGDYQCLSERPLNLTAPLDNTWTPLASSIYSPGYPNQTYPGNLDCTWLIRSESPLYRIRLEVIDMDLESPTSARNSTVLCSNRSRILYSSGQNMFVLFHSERGTDRVGRTGFHLQYCPDLVADMQAPCKDPNNLVELQANFYNASSITYPHEYSNCAWRITAYYNGVVKLRVMRIDLGSCSRETLIVYDGYDASGKVIARLCSLPYRTLYSSGPFMYIEFQTDVQKTHASFQLMYDTVPSAPAASTTSAPTTTYSLPPMVDAGAIVGSVLGGVFVIILAICFVCCCCPCRGKDSFHGFEGGPTTIPTQHLQTYQRNNNNPRNNNAAYRETTLTSNSPRNGRVTAGAGSPGPAYTALGTSGSPRRAPYHPRYATAGESSGPLHTSSGTPSTPHSTSGRQLDAGITGPARDSSLADAPPSYFSLERGSSAVVSQPEGDTLPPPSAPPPTPGAPPSAPPPLGPSAPPSVPPPLSPGGPPPYTDAMQALYPPADSTRDSFTSDRPPFSTDSET